MTHGTFTRVLVPIEFERVTSDEVAVGRAVEVGDHEWVSLGPGTIAAIELAARLVGDGELWVVHATPDFTEHAGWMSPASIAELDRGAAKHATTVFEALVRPRCPDAELRYLIEPRRPLDLILGLARSHPPDAIILAASGRGRVQRAFLGSTADKVIRAAPCPVVVVPSGTL